MVGRMASAAVFIAVAWAIGVLAYWQVDVIHRGGPLMVPIIMCSVFALAIVLERLAYFLRLGADPTRFFEQLRALVAARRWQEADALCAAASGPVARVARAALAVRDHPMDEIERAAEEAAHEELPLVERHHRWLSTIAQVATLLGLLGTVTGMVATFQVIQHKAASASPVSPADLAGGIWEALITTVGGLEVAIPTILAYHYLSSRSADVQYQMERAAVMVAGWRRAGAGRMAREAAAEQMPALE
jgi:biopolymer transport protein ExbB